MKYTKLFYDKGMNLCHKLMQEDYIYLLSYYPEKDISTIYKVKLNFIRIDDNEFRVRGNYKSKSGKIKKVTTRLENIDVINSLSFKLKTGELIKLLECIVSNKDDIDFILNHMKFNKNKYDYNIITRNHVNPGRFEETKMHQNKDKK